MTIRRIYGFTELAERIGAKVGTVRVWHVRGHLPKPDEILATGPVWYAETVDSWVAERRKTTMSVPPQG